MNITFSFTTRLTIIATISFLIFFIVSLIVVYELGKEHGIEIIKEEKNLSFELNKSLKKIRSFENSGSNPLNENYRKEKEAIDQNIEGFLIKKGGLIQSIADLNGRLGVLNKQISELENKQKLIGDDLKKLSLAEKVLIKIENI
mgnify:CR=1 FL=1